MANVNLSVESLPGCIINHAFDQQMEFISWDMLFNAASHLEPTPLSNWFQIDLELIKASIFLIVLLALTGISSQHLSFL